MAIQDEIAAAEAALASVQAAIARVRALMAGPGGSNPGLASTLADLETRETALQIQLANLRAAAVVVRGPAATRGRARAGAPAPAGRAAGGAAPPSARAVIAFARRANALADVTLKTVAGSAPAPRRRARKMAKKR